MAAALPSTTSPTDCARGWLVNDDPSEELASLEQGERRCSGGPGMSPTEVAFGLPHAAAWEAATPMVKS